MIIQWRDEARAELRAVIIYLRQHNPDAARRINATIRQRVNRLAEHPGLGRAGSVPGTRELVITGTPYILPYTVDSTGQIVVVLRVFHGAQQYPRADDEH